MNKSEKNVKFTCALPRGGDHKHIKQWQKDHAMIEDFILFEDSVA